MPSKQKLFFSVLSILVLNALTASAQQNVSLRFSQRALAPIAGATSQNDCEYQLGRMVNGRCMYNETHELWINTSNWDGKIYAGVMMMRHQNFCDIYGPVVTRNGNTFSGEQDGCRTNITLNSDGSTAQFSFTGNCENTCGLASPIRLERNGFQLVR